MLNRNSFDFFSVQKKTENKIELRKYAKKKKKTQNTIDAHERCSC